MLGRESYDSPWPAPLPEALTQDQASRLLQARSPEIASLQCQTRTVIQRRRRPGKLDLSVTLLYQSPEQLRLIARQPGIEELAMDWLMTGDAFMIQLPRQGAMSWGSLRALRAADNPLGRLRPLLVVDALTAENLLAQALADPDAQAEWKIKRERYDAMLESGGRRFEYRLRRTDLLPERLIISDDQGKKLARIYYEGFNLDADTPVPSAMKIVDVLSGTILRVKVKVLKRNPALKNAVFQMQPNPRLRYIPPDELQLD